MAGGGAEAEEEARRRRLVPVLRAISVAWAYNSGDVAVAAAACGALGARGDGHADAPLLAARHALLCAKSGDAAAARSRRARRERAAAPAQRRR